MSVVRQAILSLTTVSTKGGDQIVPWFHASSVSPGQSGEQRQDIIVYSKSSDTWDFKSLRFLADELQSPFYEKSTLAEISEQDLAVALGHAKTILEKGSSVLLYLTEPTQSAPTKSVLWQELTADEELGYKDTAKSAVQMSVEKGQTKSSLSNIAVSQVLVLK